MRKIASNQVWINERFVPASIWIDGDKIVDVTLDIQEDASFTKHKIIPGMFDIHCHGYLGYEANSGEEEGLIRWLKQLPKEGVTSFLPSTSTRLEPVVKAALEAIVNVIDQNHEGTIIEGIHIEGPQISAKFKGAHNPDWIQKPDLDQIKRYIEYSKGHLKLILIAPEEDDNHTVIRYLDEVGIRVAIGHTAATFDEAARAINDGASNFTHTYNAMRGLHHREPGVVGAAMYFQDVYAELIADGVHVHPAACLLLARAKGKDKLISVTDSTMAKGLPIGVHGDETRPVIVDETSIRLADGTLTGSKGTMIENLRKMIEVMGIDPVVAINASTINPARFIKLDNRIGLIKRGFEANLTMYDGNYVIQETIIKGKTVYQKDNHD